ncbi:flagellar basal-body rod protein FlgG (distal rod protein) [Salmonella enterica subsp. enterica]|uniref:Flagellar basal-body rod protein FlgG (Distal rod protein) n=1 Tax=Salmonella enterica I TaxID=59201 RepID=A0A447MU80_SALET|nr:flagellar basal-body rod protein FlgG (distal rod protein) [Salmonella enterica subsp. enterica]
MVLSVSARYFEDLLYQTIRQPGAQSSEQTTLPSGLQIGTGVRPVATERLHSQGNLSQTNNSKDVAIKGQGFFQVMLPDGTSAYTRDGSFQVDQNGQLVTAGGFQVQPAITIPAQRVKHHDWPRRRGQRDPAGAGRAGSGRAA